MYEAIFFEFLSEVSFLNIRFRFRKECYCIDLRRALLFSGIILALGMLVRLLSGDTHAYRLLLLPRCALGVGAYIVVGTVFYFLMGFAIELVWSHVPCFSRVRYTSLVMCVSAMLLSYLRHFFFFGMNAFFLSFVAAILACVLLVLAFLRLIRLCLPCSLIILAFAAWNAYIGFVNFCIFLLN